MGYFAILLIFLVLVSIPRVVTSIILLLTDYKMYWMKVKFFERIGTLVLHILLALVFYILEIVFISKYVDGNNPGFYTSMLILDFLVLIGNILLDGYFWMCLKNHVMKDENENNEAETPAPIPSPALVRVSGPGNYPSADLPPPNPPNIDVENPNPAIENRIRIDGSEFNVNVPQPNQPEPINPEPNLDLVGAAQNFMKRLEENKGQVVEDNNNNDATGANIHQGKH